MPWTALRRLVRPAFLVVALALVAVALRDQGPGLRAALSDLGVVPVLLSQVAVLAGLLASALCWRAVLLALGSPLPLAPSLHVFFVGQLGKYLPGNVFAIAAQAELARDHKVPRVRVVLAGLVFLVVLVTSGLVVAGAALPLTSTDALRRYAWVLPALPVGLVLLVPAVLQRVLGRVLALLRRPPLDGPVDPRALGSAAAWALLMWGCYGLHVLPLVLSQSHGHVGRLLAEGTGGYALAWSAGLLFVVAPAGAVIREAVLVLVLAPTIGQPGALAVALVSRAVQTVGDLAWALVGGTWLRRR